MTNSSLKKMRKFCRKYDLRECMGYHRTQTRQKEWMKLLRLEGQEKIDGHSKPSYPEDHRTFAGEMTLV